MAIVKMNIKDTVEHTLEEAMALLEEAGQVVMAKAWVNCPELGDTAVKRLRDADYKAKISHLPSYYAPKISLSSASRAIRVGSNKAIEGDIVTRIISFTAKTGKSKGKHVSFKARTTSGRIRGALKATLRVTERKSKGTVRVYAGNNSDVFYGRFVEKGTVRMKPRAFLRPALNSSKPEIRSIMGVK